MTENHNNTRVKVPTNLTPDEDTNPIGTNDVLPLNPLGRGKTENGELRRRKLLSCKKPIVVSTMNVRTIREHRCKEELVSNFIALKLEILGIQEHRIVHDESLRYEKVLGRTLITSSATRNSMGAAVGGVGILLNNKSFSALASVKPYTDRILVANFQGNPATTVVVTYCPTNVADDDIIEEHYNRLRGAIDAIPAHNLVIVVGDFNARIGSDDAKFTFHEATNRNGEHLLNLASEKEFVIANTYFRKKIGKLWTYISPGGNKYQLDYILVRKKWRNSIKNAEAYNTFASVGSDHRMVSARIRLSLRKSKTMPRKKQYDWSLLRHDAKLQERYAIEVRNRFLPLQDQNETATEKYDRFIKATQEATEEVIPTKEKGKRAKFSSDPRVVTARENIKGAYNKYEQATSDECRIKYKEAKKDLEEVYNTVMEEDLTTKLNDVESAHINSKHGKSWRLINDITGRKASRTGQLKGDTQEARIKNWYNHFKDLLGSPPCITNEDEETKPVLADLNIREGPFDKEEYELAKKTLVEGKSCGEDNIPPEVLKRCNIDDIILEFCNNALTRGEKPDQWSILNIVPIPKSGDLSLGGNYRGISLSSLVAKTFNRMILNRIRPAIDDHLRFNQNGFRSGRTTIGHILAIRRLIEGVKSNNLTAVLTFIDFKKAFDTIHRGKMLKILTAYGIPEQLVNAIASTYTGTKAKVLSPDGETKLFEIQAGVLQGDTLAPYLFVIVVDYALRDAISGREEELGFQIERRQSRRIGPEVLTDLDFADDIALLSSEIHQAQSLLSKVESSVAKVGLKMNTAKTKFMSFNLEQPVNIKTNDGSDLKEVDDFKYLGAWMQSSEKDIKTRKAAAWRACNKMQVIWKSTILPRKFKERLFTATVESVLLYGCETWTLTPRLEKQLNGCYTRMLRTVFNVNWSEHVTNKALYGGLPKLSDKIRERRTRFAGHCSRSAKEPVSKLVHWIPKHGRRSRGRPTLTYIDILKRDTGLEVEELKTAMQDRKTWKAFVVREFHSF